MFSNNHRPLHVSVLISIGEWGDDAPPSERCSFYLWIRLEGNQYQVSVRDAAESPWGDVDIFGRTLNRAEALAHPRISDIFHITDHIVIEDKPVIDFLAEGQEGVSEDRSR
jgi:hypothetical protein